MKLSIITINFNNVAGLQKTLASVTAQTYRDIEHVIVDAASSDGSVDIIKEYAEKADYPVSWISEKDKGVYAGMNKGIEIVLGRRVVNALNRSELVEDKNIGIKRATGDYIQILNSGDILTAPDVTERMMAAMNDEMSRLRLNEPLTLNDGKIDILYGNMIKKDYTTGKIIGKSREVEYSLRNYYSGTMNHDCCYIRRDLFDIYGLYDESLKIVSDWKWFLQAVGLGQVKPEYVDIDVTIFDASGISETNLALRNQERQQVLDELLPPAVLADYAKYTFPMEEYNRLKKYHLWGLAWFVERVFFKLEKWHILR